MLPLTGRSAQLAWLTDQLSAGGSAVVAGEAGVGKTRLVAEVAARATAEGRPVARVVAAGSGLTLPLAPLAHLLPADIDPAGGLDALRQALDALRALGTGQRLLITVDDAQHLDELSALVLQQAIVGEVVQVVATVRTATTVPEPVEQIWRGPGGARLDLQPLDPASTGALVEAALGGPTDSRTLALVDRAAKGSPLMVLELLAHGRATGRLRDVDGLWCWSGELGVSPRLREIVEVSLERLTSAEREVVEIVALAEPLPIQIVELLAPDGLAASLEARRVLAPGAQPGLVRPGHPLIGEAVQTSVQPLARRRLLGRVVDAFAVLGARDKSELDADDRARVALWSLDAGRDVSIDELRSTAVFAESRHATIETERLARAAFDCEPDVRMGLILGRSLLRQRRATDAEAIYDRMAALPATDAELVELAIGRAQNLRFGLGDIDGAAAVLDEARRRIGDPALAWELAATEARDAVLAGHLDTIPPLWDAADDAPARARYRLAESATAAFGAMGQLRKAADIVDWVESVAPEHAEHSPTALPLAQHWLAASRANAGEVAAVEAMARPVYDRAVRDGQTTRQAYLATSLAVARLLAGDALAAEQLGREAALAPASSRSVRSVGLAMLARALIAQDRIDDAAEALATIEAERDPRLRAAVAFERLAAALVVHARHQEADALGALDQLFHDAAGSGSAVVALHVAVELIGLGGRRATIEEAIRLAADVEGALAPLVAGFGATVLAHDVQGLEAVADRAVSVDLRSIAVAALTSAIEHERDVGRLAGAARVAERRDVILADCPGLVVRDRQVDLGLSPRERDVAALAARGVPDKRIAADLGISVRTVNAHLRSIYTKVGVSSRLDLADVPGLVHGDDAER